MRPWHIGGLPNKDIPIDKDKVNEYVFLINEQCCSDLHRVAELPRSTPTAFVPSMGFEEVESKALIELGEPSKEAMIMEATKQNSCSNRYEC